MKKIIYTLLIALVFLGLGMSCTDESLYPLPYNDRTTGAYLRIYNQTSTVFDLNDLTNSAFEAVFEPVDENNGDDLASIEFFVSHRRGTDLTQEVFLTSVDANIFQAVPEPTYSVYKRGTVRLPANDILNALRTITTDPDGDGSDTNGDGRPGDQCPHCVPLKGLAAFGAAGNFLAGDQILIRYEMVMTDGRRFSVANAQTGVNVDFANTATANSTPNITTGQFYNSPFLVIMTVRSVISAAAWTGQYSLVQESIWSPNHSVALHATSYPAYMNEVLFPNQTVNISKPANGLSTEREFTVSYRGVTTTMRINLENGTVFVPLINTTVDCTPEREIYWTFPTSGTFAGTTALALGLPQSTVANRGAYSTAIDGLTVGNSFTIGLDDDADEYGRRNGYCTWTRRVRLVLTKLP